MMTLPAGAEGTQATILIFPVKVFGATTVICSGARLAAQEKRNGDSTVSNVRGME